MTEDLHKLTRRELYKLVWETPVDRLARRFGLSGRGLGKLCDRHSIPVPPRGYWAEKAAGKRVVRPPLIDIETPSSTNTLISALRRPKPTLDRADTGTETAPDPYRELRDQLWPEVGPIRTPKTLSSPHPIIAAWLKEEEQDLARYRTLGEWRRPRSRFASKIERRRLRILSTLLKALEARGFRAERDQYRPLDILVHHDRDEIRFDIKERYRQARRPLTEAEKAGRWNAGREWTQTREASNELVLKLGTPGPPGIQTSWKDDATGGLEGKLQDVVVGFLVVAAYSKHRREAHEADERRRLEAQRLAWQIEQQDKAEKVRLEALVRDAENWRKAQLLRDYVAAVTEIASPNTASLEGMDLLEWSAWASNHAHNLDPITSTWSGRRIRDETSLEHPD